LQEIIGMQSPCPALPMNLQTRCKNVQVFAGARRDMTAPGRSAAAWLGASIHGQLMIVFIEKRAPEFPRIATGQFLANSERTAEGGEKYPRKIWIKYNLK